MRIALWITAACTVMLLCIPATSQQKKGPAKNVASPAVTITAFPPVDAAGHPTVTNPIAGTTRGADPSACRVVVYARTDLWYVQPTIDGPLTEIGDDGSWNTSTHPGAHYAAVLVCGMYNPPDKSDALPTLRAPVMAIDIKPPL